MALFCPKTYGKENISGTFFKNSKKECRKESGYYYYEINGTTYEYDTATGTAGEKKPTLADITKDNYGDYIDLGQNVVGTESTTDDWRILYNDKNGHVYAILADYLPNTNAAVTASELHVVDNTTYNVSIELELSFGFVLKYGELVYTKFTSYFSL